MRKTQDKFVRGTLNRIEPLVLSARRYLNQYPPFREPSSVIIFIGRFRSLGDSFYLSEARVRVKSPAELCEHPPFLVSSAITFLLLSSTFISNFLSWIMDITSDSCISR